MTANPPDSPQNRPQDAGGASGAIYKWLDLTSFPDEVRAAIKKRGIACYHLYYHLASAAHVIHVVGPDFRETPSIPRGAAIAELRYTFHYYYYYYLKAFCARPLLQPRPSHAARPITARSARACTPVPARCGYFQYPAAPSLETSPARYRSSPRRRSWGHFRGFRRTSFPVFRKRQFTCASLTTPTSAISL